MVTRLQLCEVYLERASAELTESTYFSATNQYQHKTFDIGFGSPLDTSTAEITLRQQKAAAELITNRTTGSHSLMIHPADAYRLYSLQSSLRLRFLASKLSCGFFTLLAVHPST